MIESLKKEEKAKTSKRSHPRVPFTKEEDNLLKKLVEEYGDANWKFISKKIAKRNARQCRDRWLNYLSPKVANKPWTIEEDQLLVKKYEELGPVWKKIATFFPNRTDINIKSRWNLRQRRIKKEKLLIAKRLYYQRILSLNTHPTSNNIDGNSPEKSNDIINNSPHKNEEEIKEEKKVIEKLEIKNSDEKNEKDKNTNGSKNNESLVNRYFSEEAVLALEDNFYFYDNDYT